MQTMPQAENLIFLISQPRAGSTLLQRILGGHPDIYTTSEPWLMLHPFYALRQNGISAEYSHLLYQSGLREFLASISPDNPETAYYEGVRRMYGYLYKQALFRTGKKLFLDKTPRYHLIIPELRCTFPNAKFIILIRNPLAVLSSMIRTWTEGNWFWFSDKGKRLDLLSAPKSLVQGIRLLGDSCVTVRYEELITSPEDILKKITTFLDIDFSSHIINYGRQDLPRWKFGDQNGVYVHEAPNSENAQEWSSHIDGPQTWRLMNEYLHALGRDLVEEMGYSFDEFQQVLLDHRPQKQLHFTVSLSFLLKCDTERTFAERNLARFLRTNKLLSKF